MKCKKHKPISLLLFFSLWVLGPYSLGSCGPLNDGDVAEDILRVFGRPLRDPSVSPSSQRIFISYSMYTQFQGCETGAYPPENVLPPPDEFEINLDLPPEYRWVGVAQAKAPHIQKMLSSLKNYTDFILDGKLFHYLDIIMPLLGATLPAPFLQELQGISLIAGIPFGEIVLYNVFYELFTVCTSIIGENANGELYHARNLDFGLFLGWDGGNATWITTENLRPMVVKLNFTRSNRTLFQAVGFAGYTGILTGIKKDHFTLTINERFNLKGGFFGLFQWLLGFKNIHWMGFLTRQVMENATSYQEAKDVLVRSPLLAPAYFILGGASRGEASIITRGQRDADVLEIGSGSGSGSGWYLLQTNYDHWSTPPFWDDRRGPGKKCLEDAGPDGVNFSTLYNVLSTRPVLNKLTTYTALMQVNSGELEVYLRECEEPCWPW